MLDNPSVTPVTNRTKERWPPADVLVKYLQDYAKIQEDAGKIHYSTTVLSVAKVTTSPGTGADAADSVEETRKNEEKARWDRIKIAIAEREAEGWTYDKQAQVLLSQAKPLHSKKKTTRFDPIPSPPPWFP